MTTEKFILGDLLYNIKRDLHREYEVRNHNHHKSEFEKGILHGLMLANRIVNK